MKQKILKLEALRMLTTMLALQQYMSLALLLISMKVYGKTEQQFWAH
jgi:hypothetical protein